jgi:hypothetical protein
MKLGGEECYEPDELPTALSRDLDCKDTTHCNKPPNIIAFIFYLFKTKSSNKKQTIFAA